MSDIKATIYTPQQAAMYGLKNIGWTAENKTRGLRLNISGIRDYFAPAMPGQLVAIVAQTSHYKSGFMHFWERQAAKQLIDEGRDNESIIHISVEECIEEQIFLMLAHYSGENAGKLAHGDVQDWSKRKAAALMVEQIPIYRVGDSLARPENIQELYLSNIIMAVEALVNGEVTGNKITPAAIFVDYLQALPIDPKTMTAKIENKRRLQVREDIYALRQASRLFNCPVVVGVQAKQRLEGAASASIQLPGIYDGEESSSIAQRSDRIIQLWMPKQTMAIGTSFDIGSKSLTVEENMLFVKVGKQRGGFPSGKTWLCRVRFDTNEIAPDAAWMMGA